MSDVFEDLQRARDLVLTCERFGVRAGPIVVSASGLDQLTSGKTYCLPCDRFYDGRCPVHGGQLADLDTSSIAVTSARAIDRLERLVAEGEINEGSRVAAVMVVVSLDSDTPEEERDELFAQRTQTFCFVEPENVRVALGMLELARDNFSGE